MSLHAPAIEIAGLGKCYRRGGGERWAVRGLDLTVPSGSVYGLLGRNGAGKTTTLRAVLGLIRADEGSVRVLGEEVPHGLPRVIGRVGSLLEGPALEPGLTGRRNLEILARLHHLGHRRIEEVLSRVELADRADEPVAGYSLGMRQRIALAAALLPDPDVLVLDEPANGLDPAGVVAMRELLRTLNQQRGVTILLSSHQLNETARLCDRLAIIHEGAVRLEGTPEDLGRGRSDGSPGEVLESIFLEVTGAPSL